MGSIMGSPYLGKLPGDKAVGRWPHRACSRWPWIDESTILLATLFQVMLRRLYADPILFTLLSFSSRLPPTSALPISTLFTLYLHFHILFTLYLQMRENIRGSNS